MGTVDVFDEVFFLAESWLAIDVSAVVADLFVHYFYVSG